MSSARNHAVRSHRSERKKRSALSGFRPQPKPGRSKYGNGYTNGGLSLGLASMRAWLRYRAKQKQRKEDGEETDGAS